MGTMDHPIGQLFDRVDDGKYHVVRFYRNGANASIELDDTAPQYKNPSGMSFVFIGDKLILFTQSDNTGFGEVFILPFMDTFLCAFVVTLFFYLQHET